MIVGISAYFCCFSVCCIENSVYVVCLMLMISSWSLRETTVLMTASDANLITVPLIAISNVQTMCIMSAPLSDITTALIVNGKNYKVNVHQRI